MSDTENMMPELTLNADAAKVEAPVLTLGGEPEAPPGSAGREKNRAGENRRQYAERGGAEAGG